MTNRIRRTLLSLATVGFALSASAMAAAAGGGPGGCGYCIGDSEFLFCEGNQSLETMCLTECGIQRVAECWQNNIECATTFGFDHWIECGFPD